tara:strand:- start:469 stop:840 length:372 start_codon:yes stop_codon:yes gene_type:complete
LIQSPLSLIRLKRELRRDHYTKLSASLAAAAGETTVSPALTKLSRSVADAVSKYRLGTRKCRSLAAVMNDAMKPQEMSDEQMELAAEDARVPFKGIKASKEELAAIKKNLRIYMTELTFVEQE